MGIDIFAVEPHKVSKDLRGYTILFYGEPKTGKTTTASKFEKNLILATETGYLAIPGVMALPIQKWSEFKQVLRQLKDPKAKETYYNITVDTSDLLFEQCEKYICNREGVEKVGDVPYGGGYTMVRKEFDEALRSIPAMGFGLILISHSQEKTFKDETGNEYTRIAPTLANQGRLVVDRMADLIGYAHPEEDEGGNTYTRLYVRGTPRFIAGSRFRDIVPSFPFTYDNLVKAIGDAIDSEAAEHNNELVEDVSKSNVYQEQNVLDFNELMTNFKNLVSALQTNVEKEEFKKKWAPKISSITDKYLGKGKKVNECTEQQAEQLSLIVDELTELVGQGI